MPKKYGTDVSVIKHKHAFVRKLRVILCTIVVVAMAASLGWAVASANNGGLSMHILGQHDKVKVGKTTYYGLNMGQYTDQADAKMTANVVSQAGGAGYVWGVDEEYIVLGAVYLNQSDCEKVINNLSENYKASIHKITLKKCKFTIENISKKEQITIRKNVEFCSEVFENLYQISMEYDTGNISNIAVSARANSLKSKVVSAKNQISLLNYTYNNVNLTQIYSTLTAIENVLDLLTNQMLTTENNLNLVKYAYADVLRASFELRNTLK